MDNRTEFSFHVMSAVISLIALVFLSINPAVDSNAIFYILPCMIDSLKALATDKGKVNTVVLGVNLGTLTASVICITLCILSLTGTFESTLLIQITCLAYPVRSIAYAIYFWTKC